MAKKDDDTQKLTPKTNRLASFIQSNLDKLYQSTYYTQPSNKKDLDDIKSKIDVSIDNIVAKNIENAGIPNISRIYTRIYDKNTENNHTLEDMLGDKAIVDNALLSFTETTNLVDLENKIDTIIKYMPKLEEALDTRKDNVLSADHFSKDFINMTNESNVEKLNIFNKRSKEIKTRYNILELADQVYDEIARYGEQFLYVVPYKKALKKLLDTKSSRINNSVTAAVLNSESCTIISESADSYVMQKPTFLKDGENIGFDIQLEFSNSNMLTSVIESVHTVEQKMQAISESALNYITEDLDSQDRHKKLEFRNFETTISDDLDFSSFKDDETSSDGLISDRKPSDANDKLNVPGCVLKKLDRKKTIPIYIEDYCMGYYYIECPEGDESFTNIARSDDPVMALKGSNQILANNETDIKRNNILKYISGELSKYIDSKFINNNQDLREEIYMILKHNDIFNNPEARKLKITFLPPEDVVHMYFKKDPKTHRGISDLQKAILPATLYASMYITNAIANMTRSQDKRVYYVKQTVDTNIAKSLLNTIEQIKKSNFNIRQIENINHILNITGRFNDYVIPTGPNGEAPINFEVMQGQQVELKTELMNILEEMAINSTDVPLELIQARQSVDYALQLTMTNSKFLRKVYNRQAKYQKFLSILCTKLYNAEYDENCELTVKLPPPMFLNITNTNQIMQNTNDFAASIAEMYLADEQNELVKAAFTRDLKLHYLGSYLDTDDIEKILIRSKQEAKKDEVSENMPMDEPPMDEQQ